MLVLKFLRILGCKHYISWWAIKVCMILLDSGFMILANTDVLNFASNPFSEVTCD